MTPKLTDIQNVFCIRPWHELSMATTGEATICHAQMRGKEKGFPKGLDGQTMSIEKDSVDAIMNSGLHKEIRLAQFRGEWHENCDNCRLKEASNSNKTFRVHPKNAREINDLRQNMLPDGTMKKVVIKRVDVRFSNLCNAACLQCGAVASTKWYDEHYGFFGEEYGHRRASNWTLKRDEHDRIKPADQRYTDELNNFWQMIEENKDTIELLIILGGEPLIMPEHDKLLKRFIDYGRANSVELFYHTNLSVINPRLIDLWKCFKSVKLSVSMDEIEDRYEIVRHPLAWSRLTANITKSVEEGFTPHNFSVCYMIPNMLRMGEIDSWFDRTGYNRSFLFVHEPKYMTINSLPREARQELIDHNRKIGTPLAIEAAMFIEQQMDVEPDPEGCSQFVRFMDYLDGTRKQDWRKQLPEVYEFLRKHITVDKAV